MTRQFASKFRDGGDDAGFILVEVLVSAALLILVGLSVFTMLEQSDKLAGQQTRRAMAANMAQSELERIRSLPIEDVAALKGTKTIVPDATKPNDKYYVTSSSKWVTDGSDEPDCTTRSGGLDYMRITTMVAWAQAGKATTLDQRKALPKPVVLSSVVTPASRASSKTNGSLSVNVDRADGTTGVSSLLVTITPQGGGTTYSDTTNANGCVVFPFVAAGPYTLSFNRPGWVDQNSNVDIEDSVSVPAGATNKVGYLYDLAGTTAAKFTTERASLTGIPGFPNLLGGTVPSQPKSLVLYNPAQTSGLLVENMSGTTDTWDTRKPLFPSKDAYTLYPGSCQENRPSTNLTNVNITAGAFQHAGTVQVPSLDVRVMSGSSALSPGNPVPGATIAFFPGCGATYLDRTPSPNPNTLMAGRLADPGYPYTTAGALCVSGVIGGIRYTLNQPMANTQFTNPSIRNVWLGATSGTGPLPVRNGADCAA